MINKVIDIVGDKWFDLTEQDKYLWYLAYTETYWLLDCNIPPHIVDRLKMEMNVITGNNFTDYILIIWDIHDFCRTPERVREFCALKKIAPPEDGIIPIGPGRGSVGGSYVCYAIDIHQCDPIKYGLYFERFLNEERIAMPDEVLRRVA